MNPHDAELLDKQLRSLHLPPRRGGLGMLALVAAFFAGIIVGGLLAKPPEPMQTAANEQPIMPGRP